MQEIEENNRLGKIRDLFKKIRDTKGTFHAKMGSTTADYTQKRELEDWKMDELEKPKLQF